MRLLHSVVRFNLALLLALALVGAAVAQDPERKKETWKTAEPSNLHAPALAFGEALEKNASAGLRDWAGPYAKKTLRSAPLKPQETTAVVDQRFPQGAEEARDAVVFLLYYLAYKEEDIEQRMLAARLRDIDRETIEITRQLQIIWKNEQNRAASPTQGLSQQQRVAIDEDVQRKESQLRFLADERQLKSGQFATSRKRVDSFLKLLAQVHPRMQGIEPSVLQALP